MSLLRIFFAWILTVLAGSFLLFPLGGYIPIISLLFSAACSLPTLITLLVVAHTNADADYRTRLERINLAHVVMFVLTLIVGYLKTENMYFILIVSYYAVIAIIIWLLMFGKEIKENKRH